MEIIKTRLQSLLKALCTLDEAIALLQNPEYKKIYNSLRDSAIQRFEYSIDNFWKFIKIYIQEKHQIPLETATPRLILREAVNVNLISESEYELLIKGITNRNLTSHSYNEEIAQILIEKIPSQYILMKTIIDRLAL